MSRLERIEKEVSELSKEELGEFRAWFETFDAARWDRELTQDVGAGALDALADDAIADHRAGRSKPI